MYGDGTYDFECQHGPEECYGNMLHACAIDKVKNHTAAFNFNVCLMDLHEVAGSNDKMADKVLFRLYCVSIQTCLRPLLY